VTSGERQGVFHREPHPMRRLIPLAIAAAAAFACQPVEPLTSVPEYNGDVCQNLAHVFFLIAESRDNGTSRRSKLAQLTESVDSPFHRQPEKTLDRMRTVVDYVYDHDRHSPEEIEAEVLGSCRVSDQGHAVLRLPSDEPAVSAAGR